jgi:MATE family multidrug resistance protein
MIDYFRRRWSSEGGYRQFLGIAFPLILSTGAWSILEFVDRVFLTWYSPESVAAAMPAGFLNYTLLSLFIGTSSYVGIFVAQYYGAHQYHRIGPAIWQGIYVSLMGGLLVLCLIPFAEPFFFLVGHEPKVRELEVIYFRVLCLGGFAPIAGASLSSFFSGRGKPWPVMWVNMSSVALNLVLDYALIFGNWGFPEMGIKGAAVATVIAGFFSFSLLMILVSRRRYRRDYCTLSGWRFERALFVRLIRFGLPSGIQFVLEMAGFTVFLLLVGRLGTIALAASNIAFNINSIAFLPMIGAGIAVSVLVGQNLGRNRPNLAQKSVYTGFQVTLSYMTTIALAYVLVPEMFIAPFAAKAESLTFQEVFPLTIFLLRFVAVYSVFDTLNIIFSSAIKGAGDTRFVMVAMSAMSAFVLVFPTYLAIFVFDRGITVAWIIASSYIILLGFVFLFRFLGGKWKSMRVIERAGAKR